MYLVKSGWQYVVASAVVVSGAILSSGSSTVVTAQSASPSGEVTFTKDIAPILQRSCQNCHRSDGVAPMSLVTYEDVRPYARAIKQRTGIGPHAGVMPPWYVEKNIGIQKFQNDPSLSDEEIAKIATWADNGAPRGNPADMPAPRVFADRNAWAIGTPDLIVKTTELEVKANAPDWWGEIPRVTTGLTEDRYVTALEVKEVNDVDSKAGSGRATVGGRYVFHHMIWGTKVLTDADKDREPDPTSSALFDESTTFWPVHEVGRNADFFGPDSARLLRANSSIVSDSVHLHSNGRDTKAHLEIGFKFAPKDYKPKYKTALFGLGNGVDIDIEGNQAGQQLHAYTVLNDNIKILSFEPHLHAPGMRMCLEAIWGYNIQTLNCVGYDHNWVRGYDYTDDSAPLLPKGTILHIIGYMDNSPSNRNVPDPRNWQGSGNRSVANMFIDLGNRVVLTDDQFKEAMQKRRDENPGRDVILGCPLCMVSAPAAKTSTQNQQQQQQQ
jgi:mono/diheme cytochrome c family protein